MNESNKATTMDKQQAVITELKNDNFDRKPYVMAAGLEIVLQDYDEPGMYHVGVKEEDFWNSGGTNWNMHECMWSSDKRNSRWLDMHYRLGDE